MNFKGLEDFIFTLNKTQNIIDNEELSKYIKDEISLLVSKQIELLQVSDVPYCLDIIIDIDQTLKEFNNRF